jgi:hypothetical protein
MKTFLFIGMSSIISLFAWVAVSPVQPAPNLNVPKCVVDFNADFNKENGYKWVNTPNCIHYSIDISKYPHLKSKYKIKSLPTIVVLKNGVEAKRWEADVTFKLNVPQRDIISFYNELR